MVFKLPYQSPRKKSAPVVLERFDASDRMTLVVHPEANWFLPLAVVLTIGAIGFAFLFGAEVFPPNDPRFNWNALAVGASIACVLILIKAWDVSRKRVVFELSADRMYVMTVGPFSRRQRVWARSTLDDVGVRRTSRPDANRSETECLYCIRVLSFYKGHNGRHDYLEGRRPELLREVVITLRAELGWAVQDPDSEAADDRYRGG